MRNAKKLLALVLALTLVLGMLPMASAQTVHTHGIEEYTEIELGETYVFEIAESGETVYVRYTPEVTAEYTFASSGADSALMIDPEGFLYDSEMNLLTKHSDNSAIDFNFTIVYTLEAGKTYVYAANLFSQYRAGVEFYVTLTADLPEEHNYVGTVTTEPTCTTDGVMTYTCAHCGDSFVGDNTAARGHAWSDWETITPATCIKDGKAQRSCTACGISETEIIHAPGHDWNGNQCGRCGVIRQTPFDDVEPGSFYETPVAWALDNGITNGIDATHFDPLGQCQRAQVVTFLWRAAGSPAPATPDNPFTDVKETDFFYKAVLWAVEQGITNGVSATEFGSYLPCNRAQVVTFLWRAQGSPAAGTSNPCTDVEAGTWYEMPVLWALDRGVTNGISATEFGVNAVCNRAQIVTFLYRAFN